MKTAKPVTVNLIVKKRKSIHELSWKGRLNWRSFEKDWSRMLHQEMEPVAVWLDEEGKSDLLDEFMKMTYSTMVEFMKGVKTGTIPKPEEEE